MGDAAREDVSGSLETGNVCSKSTAHEPGMTDFPCHALEGTRREAANDGAPWRETAVAWLRHGTTRPPT